MRLWKIRIVRIIQRILTDHCRVPSSVGFFFLLNFKFCFAQEIKTRDTFYHPQESITASLKIANLSKLVTFICVFVFLVTQMLKEKIWLNQNLEDYGKKVSTR